MGTNSRLIKPDNYPPFTLEEMQENAIRFIVSNVRASTNQEARDIARASRNPALREAARILDERDAARIVERSRANMAAGPGPSGEGVAQRSPEPVASSPAAPESMASQYAAKRYRGADGQFIPAKFVRQFDGVRRLLRDLREGGAE